MKRKRNINAISREHYEMSKQLNREYYAVYSDMVVYIKTSRVSDEDAEDVLADILDIMMSAQERGESVESVFGSDYQGFCDEMIRSVGELSKRNWTSDLLRGTPVLLNISIFFAWFNTLEQKGPFDFGDLTVFHLSVAFLLYFVFTVVAVVVIMNMYHRLAFRVLKNGKPRWVKFIPAVLVYIVLVFLIAYICRTLGSWVLASFHIGWLIALMAAIWLIGKTVAFFLKSGTAGENVTAS